MTFDNVSGSILASLPLFRLGIAAFILKQVAFQLLPSALYGLFEQTSRTMATLMVALAVASVPIALVGLTRPAAGWTAISVAAFAVPMLFVRHWISAGEVDDTCAATAGRSAVGNWIRGCGRCPIPCTAAVLERQQGPTVHPRIRGPRDQQGLTRLRAPR